MDNREFYIDFLKRHNISPNKLAKIMRYTPAFLFQMRGTSKTVRPVKDSFVYTLKCMDKMYELTGEFV